jgi:alpha-1,2-mannosyltransferase
MLDLRVYLWGGLIARRSGNLYGDYFPYHHLRFTYPPAAALIFEFMSAVPLPALKVLFTAASITSIIGSLWLTWGLLGHRRSVGRLGAALSVASIALWLGPVQQTLQLGQINLLLMLMVLADFRLREDAWVKGIAIGLAAGLKLTPLIFIVYMFLTRRPRAAAVSLGTFALTMAISLILLPSQTHQFWFGRLFLDSNRAGNNAYVGNQSLHGMLARLTGDPSVSHLRWAVVPVIVGLSGLALAAWWSRRGYDAMGVLTCALTGLLISPVSWVHHWVWIAPGLTVTMEAAVGLQASMSPARRCLAWLCLTVLMVPFFTVPQSLVPGPMVQGHGLKDLQVLTSNSYVIVGLVLLCLAGWSLGGAKRRENQVLSDPVSEFSAHTLTLRTIQRASGGSANPAVTEE